MNAKIIQLSTLVEEAEGSNPSRNILVALCEDGTIWETVRKADGKYEEWVNVYERHKSRNHGGMLT